MSMLSAAYFLVLEVNLGVVSLEHSETKPIEDEQLIGEIEEKIVR